MTDKFAPGSEVTEKPRRYNHYFNTGKVMGPVADEPTMVLVEYSYGNIRKCRKDDLITVEEAKAIKSQLEAEFEVSCSKVEPKVQEAIALLKEANELARLNGITIDELGREVTDALNDEIGSAGWNTSSYHC